MMVNSDKSQSNEQDLLRKALKHINMLEDKIQALQQQAKEPIAIIGLACKFPGAEDNQQFWQLLMDGKNTTRPVPKDRWNSSKYYSENPDEAGKIYTKCGNFLNSVFEFDPNFFDLSETECLQMDPQHRLLLETSYKALENSFIDISTLRKKNVGFFVGIMNQDYSYQSFVDLNKILIHTGLGNGLGISAGRLAYFYGTYGPALAIDTTCSSSLVAIHLACESLKNDESEMALACGVSLTLEPAMNFFASRLHALAKDGLCKTFDDSADGLVRGEGCGVIVLKKLSAAIRDNHNILAVISGSAVNHDGKTSGFSVPSGISQQMVIENAIKRARINPHEINYIETHGTGTQLGDPIELNVLASIFANTHTKENPLIIGSVKTNIGHLEPASGIAGLIKVVLSLNNEKIPKHLNFKNPTRQFNWKEMPLKVSDNTLDWKKNEKKRIAGISAFGLSGTNAHIVLEEFTNNTNKELINESVVERTHHFLKLSAKSDRALKMMLSNIKKIVSSSHASTKSLASLAYSYNNGRGSYNKRAFLVFKDVEDLHHKITEREASYHHNEIKSSGQPAHKKIGWLFSGQGSQWFSMGKALYDSSLIYRDVIDRCDVLFKELKNTSLKDILFHTNNNKIFDTLYAQPSLFATSCALTTLWKEWGILPHVVLGHSTGEYAAAYCAGVFSLEDGFKLITKRAELIETYAPPGNMASVISRRLDAEDAFYSILVKYRNSVTIASYNGPKTWVISGDEARLALCCEELQKHGFHVKKLKVSQAGHSPLLEPLRALLREEASKIKYYDPQIPLVSNLTGKLVKSGEINADYWARHLIEPVHFKQSMEYCASLGVTTYQEMGPKAVLLGMGEGCVSGDNLWLPSLCEGRSDWEYILESVGTLWLNDISIDWRKFDQSYAREWVNLPNYPFQNKYYKLQDSIDPALMDWFYVANWQPLFFCLNIKKRKELAGACNWIVFVDQSDTLKKLVDCLIALGANTILIKAGKKFSKLSDDRFEINPSSKEDYSQLFAHLYHSCEKPWQIVYGWSLDSPENSSLNDPNDIIKAQGLSVVALLNLAQSLLHAKVEKICHLHLITRYAQDEGVNHSPRAVNIAQSAAWGLGKVLNLDSSNLKGILLDIDNQPLDGFQIVDILLNDLNEKQILIRNGSCYGCRIKQVEKSKLSFQLFQGTGTYLITGGLSGIGLVVANWLAKKGVAHIALLGRSGIKNDFIKAQIDEIKSINSNLTIYQADVSNYEQMKTVIADIKQRHPPLKGVIHAAGLMDEVKELVDHTIDTINQIQLSKTAGAWILNELTSDCDLENFVMFSSGSSVWGSRGIPGYVIGNQVLDAMTSVRLAQNRPTTTINWGVWGGENMATRSEFREFLKLIGNRFMDPALACDALEISLSSTDNQVIIANVDWAAYSDSIQVYSPTRIFDHVTENLTQSRVAHFDNHFFNKLNALSLAEKIKFLSHNIKQIISESIKSNDFEYTTPINTLGISSLTGLEMKNTLQKLLGVDVPIRKFMEGFSINDLAHYILEKLQTVTTNNEIIPESTSNDHSIQDKDTNNSLVSLWQENEL